jgi:hypothetical protein
MQRMTATLLLACNSFANWKKCRNHLCREGVVNRIAKQKQLEVFGIIKMKKSSIPENCVSTQAK